MAAQVLRTTAAALLWNFVEFLTQSYCPPQERAGCAFVTVSPVFSILPRIWGCVHAGGDLGGGNEVPEPSALTCIVISYWFECQKHTFPPLPPPQTQEETLVGLPERRAQLNVPQG